MSLFKRLCRILFCWSLPEVVSPDKWTEKPDAILAISFGGPEVVTNQKMAVKGRSIKLHCPTADILAQWEVAQHLSKGTYRLVGQWGDPHIRVISFLQEVKQKFPEIKKVALVSGDDYWLRCRWLAEGMGFEVIGQSFVPCDYDSGSAQWWTRSEVIFMMWEFASRIHHLALGLI